MAEMEFQWARYPNELDGQGGTYGITSLRLEYAFNERISLAARLPFAGIWPSDSHATYGVGDTELSLKWSIIRPKSGFGHLSVGTGFAKPVPTDR